MEKAKRDAAGLRGLRFGAVLLSAAGCLAAAGFTTRAAALAAPACDATTGASCKVVGVRTTLTQATLSWTESRRNGTRHFCYGIGSPTKCGLVASRATGVKNEVVTGLAPRTTYAYKFYGLWKGKTKSVVTGTFRTDSSGCGSTVVTVVEIEGVALSADGDSLENVVVTLTRSSDGRVMGTDTTDRSGGYFFEADPGAYKVALAYPPFTPPAPYSATVIAKKPLTIPDQILKDAFQLGGTVVNRQAGDSLANVLVSLYRLADNSLVASRLTDEEGHFSFGLKSGAYRIVASQGGSSAAPVPVTVSRSMELADLIFSAGSGLKTAIKAGNGGIRKRPAFDFLGRNAPPKQAESVRGVLTVSPGN